MFSCSFSQFLQCFSTIKKIYLYCHCGIKFWSILQTKQEAKTIICANKCISKWMWYLSVFSPLLLPCFHSLPDPYRINIADSKGWLLSLDCQLTIMECGTLPVARASKTHGHANPKKQLIFHLFGTIRQSFFQILFVSLKQRLTLRKNFKGKFWPRKKNHF